MWFAIFFECSKWHYAFCTCSKEISNCFNMKKFFICKFSSWNFEHSPTKIHSDDIITHNFFNDWISRFVHTLCKTRGRKKGFLTIIVFIQTISYAAVVWWILIPFDIFFQLILIPDPANFWFNWNPSRCSLKINLNLPRDSCLPGPDARNSIR